MASKFAKHKYAILGNVTGASVGLAIALTSVDWRISLGFAILSAITGNYLVYIVKKDISKVFDGTIGKLVNSLGKYVGLKYENGKVIEIDVESGLSNLEKYLKNE